MKTVRFLCFAVFATAMFALFACSSDEKSGEKISCIDWYTGEVGVEFGFLGGY